MLRRGTALAIDLYACIVPALFLALLPGLFLPLDEHLWVSTMVALPLIVLGLGYVFMGPAFLSNTYGRYVTAVRVRDQATGERPGFGQALIRAFNLGLWPVEAVMIVDNGRRMGDRLAGTVVERYSPGGAWWKRAAPGLAVISGGIALLWGMSPVVGGRPLIAREARAFTQSQLGAQAGNPRYVAVRGDSGEVGMTLRDGRGVRVYLARSRGAWRARQLEEVSPSQLGRGISIQQGAASLSAP
ncbi:MAG TPA: RDD family protein [Longimicrobium sp.]|uniref:RDD family protein n=1 Tax=Longimicrobium sp. TaxID=2029185 RepID=UPI002EDA6A89